MAARRTTIINMPSWAGAGGGGGGGTGQYTLPPATTGTLGGVKVGSGLEVAADGLLSVVSEVLELMGPIDPTSGSRAAAPDLGPADAGHTYVISVDGVLDPSYGLGAVEVKQGDLLIWGGDAWLLRQMQDGLPGPQGEPGAPGEPGSDGLSAYEVAVANGFTGTEAEWLASLEGADGADGPSAYEVAVAQGFTGTEAEWLASLVGPEGPQGIEGPMGTQGIGIRYVSTVETEADLPATATQGDLYVVATPEPAHGFVWDDTTASWVDSGPVQGPQGIQGIQGIPGPAGPTAVSNDEGNVSTLGSDGLILTKIPYPESMKLGGVFASFPQKGLYVSAIDTDGLVILERFEDNLPPATASTLGAIKVGSGLAITADGTLSAAGVSGAYLPLAGGTMTGTINVPATKDILRSANGFSLYDNAATFLIRKDDVSIVAFGPTLITSTVPVKLPADPTQPLEAATKQYVDNKAPRVATASVLGAIKVGTGLAITADGVLSSAVAGNYLLKTGDAMTGPLRFAQMNAPSTYNGTDWYQWHNPTIGLYFHSPTGKNVFIHNDGRFRLGAAPVDAMDAVNRAYLDTALTDISGYLKTTGGTMTGAITLPTTVQSLVWGTTTYNIFGGTGGVAMRHGTNNIVVYTSTAATYTQQIIASATTGIVFGASNSAGFKRGSVATKIAATGMIELPTTAPTAADAIRRDFADATYAPKVVLAELQAEIEALKAEVATLKGAV
jgi:hypothetical protein